MPLDTASPRFGTSSWAYEGWQGLVYHRTYPKSRFSQDTLAEYAAYRMHDTPLCYGAYVQSLDGAAGDHLAGQASGGGGTILVCPRE
jgi:hypothetical protein